MAQIEQQHNKENGQGGNIRKNPLQKMRNMVQSATDFLNREPDLGRRNFITQTIPGAIGAVKLAESGLAGIILSSQDLNARLDALADFDNNPEAVSEQIESMGIIPESVQVYRVDHTETGDRKRYNVTFAVENADSVIPAWENSDMKPHAQFRIANMNLSEKQAVDLRHFFGGSWTKDDVEKSFPEWVIPVGAGVAMMAMGDRKTKLAGGLLTAAGGINLLQTRTSFFQSLAQENRALVASMASVAPYLQAGLDKLQLYGCQPAPGTYQTAQPPLHEPVPEPSETPQPTFEVVPTDTVIPFEAGAWAENREGLIDPENFSQFVGDWVLTDQAGQKLVTTKNRAVDLSLEGMRLIYLGNENVQLEGFDQKAYRSQIAGELDKNTEFKRKISDIKAKLETEDVTPSLVTVVINGPDFVNTVPSPYAPWAKIPAFIPEASISSPKITSLVASLGETPPWYVVDESDGIELRRLTEEEKPTLMPQLSVNSGKYIRTDNGDEHMMRGVNMMNFHFKPNKIRDNDIHWALEGLKEAGGNFLVIAWNGAYANDLTYVTKLMDTIKTAKFKYGFRVMLTLSDNGNLPGSDYDPEMIRIVDGKIPQFWSTLLNFKDPDNHNPGFPDFASLARKAVDVFQIVNEPNDESSVFNAHLDAANTVIRNAVGENAITGYSNGSWFATGATELLDKEDRWNSTHTQSTVVIHPYKLNSPESDRPTPSTYLAKLKANGVLVTVGEVGWKDWEDNPEWVMEQIRFFEKNKISYSIVGDAYQLYDFWKAINAEELSKANSEVAQ